VLEAGTTLYCGVTIDGLAKKIAKKVVRLRLRTANKTEAIRQDKVAKPNSYQHWRTIVERTFKYKFPF